MCLRDIVHSGCFSRTYITSLKAIDYLLIGAALASYLAGPTSTTDSWCLVCDRCSRTQARLRGCDFHFRYPPLPPIYLHLSRI